MKCVTLTVGEAAAVLGISRSSAYEAVRVGQIPALNFGKRLVVPLAALEAITGAKLEVQLLNAPSTAKEDGKWG